MPEIILLGIPEKSPGEIPEGNSRGTRGTKIWQKYSCKIMNKSIEDCRDEYPEEYLKSFLQESLNLP